MEVKLLTIQPSDNDKAWLVEHAARVCRRSQDSDNVVDRYNFLRGLVARGELSPFEQARFCEFDYVFRTPRPDEVIENRDGYYIRSFNARHVLEEGRSFELRDVFERGAQICYAHLTPEQRVSHATATFEIGGISRVCSHQIVRHRTMSYSQESQRHVNPTDAPIVPPSIEHNQAAFTTFMDAMTVAVYAVNNFPECIPLEDARYILPQAMPTRMVVTGRFSAWQHFLKLRTTSAAQWEIRAVALEIQRQLRAVEPEVFA